MEHLVFSGEAGVSLAFDSETVNLFKERRRFVDEPIGLVDV
jgi:hypothetical protein